MRECVSGRTDLYFEAREDIFPYLAEKEIPQFLCSVDRVFFGEEVSALHRTALDIGCPLSPDSQGTTCVGVERVEGSAGSPQMEHRASDLVLGVGVLTVVFDVNGRRILPLLRVRLRRCESPQFTGHNFLPSFNPESDCACHGLGSTLRSKPTATIWIIAR